MKTYLSLLLLLCTPLCRALRFPGKGPSARILTGEPVGEPIGVAKAPAPAPEVRSRGPWRLEIEEGSLLVGTPGQRANIRIRLSNLEQRERVFSMTATESGRGVFRFIESQSTSQLSIPGGEFKVLTLNLRIPEGVSSGHRNIIRITATVADTSQMIRVSTLRDTRVNPNFIQLDLSFLIAYSFSDTQGPRISSFNSPVESQCSNVKDCARGHWKAIYEISDAESGIRSIETDPFLGLNSGSLQYFHNNYILGDPNQVVRLVLMGSCCEKKLKLTVADGYGNQETQRLTPEESSISNSNPGLGPAEIAIIVVSILLLVILIGVATGIIIVRQRRAESINEMRRFPAPEQSRV